MDILTSTNGYNLKTNKLIFNSIAYFIVLTLNILAGEGILNSEWGDFTKPILIPILINGFIYQTKNTKNRFFYYTIAGLILSWFGDILLMYVETDSGFFIAGLISFLLAHVAYILSFTNSIRNPLSFVEVPTKQLPLYAIILAYSALFFYRISPYLGDMFAPVLIYLLVITTMGLTALRRYGFTLPISFYFTFLGAIFFMASDSCLAYNKFVTPIPASSFWIMATYGIAQFCIKMGAIHHLNQFQKTPVN